jgi:hypothetical protein
LNDKSFFTKDGSYMDPMRDLLALFSNVSSTENLAIEYEYTFKMKKVISKQMRELIKMIW